MTTENRPKETSPLHSEILIVDDDKICSFIHARILQVSSVNNPVKTFSSGPQMIHYLRKKETEGSDGAFLILLDLNMPVMDAWLILDYLEKNPFDFPIYNVIITSSVTEADRIRAFRYRSVKGYFEKPFNLLDLQKITQLEEIKPLLALQENKN